MIVPVILSGGIGSRLWPLSREDHPKPFVKLNDGQSLIQKAYQRAIEISNVEEVISVTNRNFLFYAKDEYAKASSNGIHHSLLLEPFGRNSTAAIATAALYAREKYGEDCILLILPADHLIDNQFGFVEAVMKAINLAAQGKLVTFGIQPDSPKTGFGYIETKNGNVKSFVEKPNLETAKKYLKSGNYYWNSGMFCMSTNTILGEMNTFCPDIVKNASASLKHASYSESSNCSQIELNKTYFERIKSISIDYSVFEKSTNVALVPCDIGWSDIGSWIEFGNLYEQDQWKNNVSGKVLLDDVTNCVIHSENRLVAGLGLSNLIIADTADAVLIAHKDYAQNIRTIVKKLEKDNVSIGKSFSEVRRPWGKYTVLIEKTGFILKYIEVKPGAAISLQSHKHRSEHWVVVSGIAKVTNADKVLELQHNQSTYIPAGNKHRLENTSDIMLVLIEIQCGDYLSEGDIVRYEDIYGREVTGLNK